MGNTDSAEALFRLVCQGDGDAAERLVRRYERELRIMARVRLTDPSLRRVVDSMDICQSVMGQFFVRAAAGELEFSAAEQLKRLLLKMLDHKVIDKARYLKADRRDVRKVVQQPAEELGLAGNQETPSVVLEAKELFKDFRARLSTEEHWIIEQRKADRSWNELAAELGETSGSLRTRHYRAVQRVLREMGVNSQDE